MGTIKPTCEHKDELIKTELSVGPNLIGKEVAAIVKRLSCIYCGSMQTKFVREVTVDENSTQISA